MDIIFLLIPLALVLVALVIWGFSGPCAVVSSRIWKAGHSILVDKDEEMDASYKVRQANAKD